MSGIIFITFLLISLTQCEEIILNAGQKYLLESTNIPSYKLYAPYNHKISISCDYATSLNEYLYLLTDYTNDDSGGQKVFGFGDTMKVIRTSLFNYAGIELKFIQKINSTENGTFKSSFKCEVEAVKSSTCECGWGRQGKIVGGVEADIGEFTGLVAIIHKEFNTPFCAGTIVTPDRIVTAAHCFRTFMYKNTSQLLIVAGVHNVSEEAKSSYMQKRNATEIIIHSNYNTSDQDNDIAIIKLDRPLIYSRLVGPACLPYKFLNETFYEQFVTIAGWGSISYGGPLSEVLLKVTVNVINTTDCSKRIVWVNDKKLCTYTPKKDACISDSGAPVWYLSGSRRFFVGIVSFGIGCASNTPAVNLRVSNYLDWIVDKVRTDELCKV